MKEILERCADCGQLTHPLGMEGQWCEDCFEKGLNKDMDDHFKETIRREMEIDQPDPENPEHDKKYRETGI